LHWLIHRSPSCDLEEDTSQLTILKQEEKEMFKVISMVGVALGLFALAVYPTALAAAAIAVFAIVLVLEVM
jgi:hypothetical protein